MHHSITPSLQHSIFCPVAPRLSAAYDVFSAGKARGGIKKSMAGRLDGKIAMITGGGSGIGAATARLFCREGARVALVDIDRKKVEEEAAQLSHEILSSWILPIMADVSSREQTNEAVSRAVAEFGGLDVLVNNAALREYFPLAEAPEESWQRIIATNILGVANCCQAAIPALRRAGVASIVNLSSVFGVVGRKGMGQYDATKAAILGLTRAGRRRGRAWSPCQRCLSRLYVDAVYVGQGQSARYDGRRAEGQRLRSIAPESVGDT